MNPCRENPFVTTIVFVCLNVSPGLAFEPVREPASQPVRPNILVLTADDLGCETPGCFGGRTPDITPNIDRLASQGMRFANGFVTVAICQPSRSTWITGRLPHRHGAVGFNPITPGVPMLGEQLRRHGYFTALVGKVDHFTPANEANWDVIVKRLPQRGRAPRHYGRQVSDLITRARRANRPFFLLVNILDPHRPFALSPQEAAEPNDVPPPSRVYRPEEVDVPGYLPDNPTVRRELAYYCNSVRRCDDAVGEALAALDASGLADHTVVMFLSDNGAPLPFAKGSCYLQSDRTPWIVRWPGRVRPGSVDEQHFVSGTDFMPTILDIAGAPLPEIRDGESFLPVLDGGRQPERDHVFVVFHRDQFRVLETRALHTKRHGYVFNAWADGRTVFVADNNIGLIEAEAARNPAYGPRVEFYKHRAPEELYDYEKDPWATKNLAADAAYAPILEQMREKMLAWMLAKGDPNHLTLRFYLNDLKKSR